MLNNLIILREKEIGKPPPKAKIRYYSEFSSTIDKKTIAVNFIYNTQKYIKISYIKYQNSNCKFTLPNKKF